MTIDSMIAVLQAAKEGKTILDSDGKVANIQQRCALQDLRVKSKPIEIEVWVHPTEKNIYRADRITAAEKDFIDCGWTKKKFREVIE